jgi:type I restriction-modification system DNA methylase subunit
MTDAFDFRNSTFGIRPVPPKGNANFAWVQHFIQQLAPGGQHWNVSPSPSNMI